MSNETTQMLAVPQTAVAAAGRALKFMIADLTEHRKRADLSETSRELIDKEVMDMMDANKAMFSAQPIQ